ARAYVALSGLLLEPQAGLDEDALADLELVAGVDGVGGAGGPGFSRLVVTPRLRNVGARRDVEGDVLVALVGGVAEAVGGVQLLDVQAGLEGVTVPADAREERGGGVGLLPRPIDRTD